MPVVPSWLLEPVWDPFAALLPLRPVYARLIRSAATGSRSTTGAFSEKLLQVPRFGSSYEAIVDSSSSATTIRGRDEWIEEGIFARLRQITLEARDRVADLVLQEILVVA